MSTKYQTWMGIAQAVARLSKDSTKVGALLIGQSGETLLSGYNGPVRGEDDNDPHIWGEGKNDNVIHAEVNLLLTAARLGISVNGCRIVVTKHPCLRCALSLQQAGISEVLCPPPDTEGRWKESQVSATTKLVGLGVRVVYVMPEGHDHAIQD